MWQLESCGFKWFSNHILFSQSRQTFSEQAQELSSTNTKALLKHATNKQTQLPPFKGNYIYSNKAVARLFPHSEASFYCAAP